MKHPEERLHLKDDLYETVLDARFFPLLVTRNRGEMTIPTFDKLMEWRNGWVAYAAKQGTKVYLIAYTTELRPPSALVRKHVAESISRDSENPGMLGTGTVVPNALLRGVMTAIIWVAGGKEKSGMGESSSNMPDAIRLAFAAFDQAKLPRPKVDPDTYDLPEFP
jgi:hypothetical protein